MGMINAAAKYIVYIVIRKKMPESAADRIHTDGFVSVEPFRSAGLTAVSSPGVALLSGLIRHPNR
jgi:hypothetical protein